MLSHELRNPLAPIRNSLFVLERSPAGGDKARQAQAVIARQVGHLSRLVDDLLDITRISRGKITLSRSRWSCASSCAGRWKITARSSSATTSRSS